MEIIKNFGLDPFLFGAQIINFLIIFYLLKRFMYKPILSVLKKRENAIKAGIKQAEDAQKLMDKTLKKEKEILKKANEQARKTIEDAKAQAKKASAEIEENSKRQAEKIILDARAQIQLESKEAFSKLSKQISELSLGFLKTATKDMFSQDEQKEVLEKAVKNLKQAD